MSPRIEILSAVEIGPFCFRWWAGEDERFTRGWEVIASVDDRAVQVRHGAGWRHAYGGRVHSVTWVELQPPVEGVAADDYATTSPCSRGSA